MNQNPNQSAQATSPGEELRTANAQSVRGAVAIALGIGRGLYIGSLVGLAMGIVVAIFDTAFTTILYSGFDDTEHLVEALVPQLLRYSLFFVFGLAFLSGAVGGLQGCFATLWDETYRDLLPTFTTWTLIFWGAIVVLLILPSYAETGYLGNLRIWMRYGFRSESLPLDGYLCLLVGGIWGRFAGNWLAAALVRDFYAAAERDEQQLQEGAEPPTLFLTIWGGTIEGALAGAKFGATVTFLWLATYAGLLCLVPKYRAAILARFTAEWIAIPLATLVMTILVGLIGVLVGGVSALIARNVSPVRRDAFVLAGSLWFALAGSIAYRYYGFELCAFVLMLYKTGGPPDFQGHYVSISLAGILVGAIGGFLTGRSFFNRLMDRLYPATNPGSLPDLPPP